MHAKDTTTTNDVNTESKSFFDSAKFKLFNALSERNFNINPFYIKLTGSISSGYFLTQLLFLSRNYGYGEFYKTDEYFMERLCMTEKEVRNHKKNLIDLGFISVIKTGFPATSHYKVNLQKIIDIAESGNIVTPDKDVSECPEIHSHAQRASLEKNTRKFDVVFGSSTAQRACKSRPKGVTDYINDLDNKNNNKQQMMTNIQASQEPLVVVSEVLKTKLNSIGVLDAVSWIMRYGDTMIVEKLSFMPHKSKINTSQAAWLRDALEKDYRPPKNAPTGKIGVSREEQDRLYRERMMASEAENIRSWYAELLIAPEEKKDKILALLNALRGTSDNPLRVVSYG